MIVRDTGPQADYLDSISRAYLFASCNPEITAVNTIPLNEKHLSFVTWRWWPGARSQEVNYVYFLNVRRR